jgi:hypothetical protein
MRSSRVTNRKPSHAERNFKGTSSKDRQIVARSLDAFHSVNTQRSPNEDHGLCFMRNLRNLL